jgi:hypothetical protein
MHATLAAPLRTRLATCALALALAFAWSALAGCRSTLYSAKTALGSDPKPMLMRSLDETRATLEECGKLGRNTFDLCRVIAESKGQASAAIEDNCRELNTKLERDLRGLRTEIRSTEDLALAHFRRWQNSTEKLEDAALRERSRTNLGAARESYTNLVSDLRNALARFEGLNAGYRDQLLFLEQNAGASNGSLIKNKLNALSEELAAAEKLIEQVNARHADFAAKLES